MTVNVQVHVRFAVEMIFKKIPKNRAPSRVQFERILKYQERCKSIIASCFILLLAYYVHKKFYERTSTAL